MLVFPMFRDGIVTDLVAESEARNLVLLGLAIECHEVGSRVTCNPPPTDTDHDFLVKVADLARFVNLMDDWEMGGSCFEEDDAGTEWASLRKGNVNLLVSADEEFISKFLAAHTVAKRLNLLHKPDRVALFQAVMYGKGCEHVPRPIEEIPY